jgi:hypothetical protein
MQRTDAFARGLFSLILSVLSASLASGETPTTKSLDFNRDIRPILSNRCFRCHGPDENERQGGGKSGLRLDTPEGISEDLGGHFAVVPGKPEQSALIARIKSQDATDVDLLMAPHHGSLSAKADKLLRWCQPETVVISGSTRAMSPKVLEMFEAKGREIFVTARDDAIRYEIASDGKVAVFHWSTDRWSEVDRK